ncbi:hypothetical protein M438DRAFT_339801 [Aureobasidium pullulans EXF-150]|uniref:Fatty acid hydroxylase domain-containing protein n=1 Tax=Aureobasidium pullulans EXF-150 TaxID=1043002 RepID=A0A074X6J4_AURPU|nr:uncharacterized protein M438DRAFT_339801 [Aureobasidium pullulans EXF-150]KEQ79404.1 hypothetical protein M438DRAFT_339801 [Aureobasidium pullulans EXF-150]
MWLIECKNLFQEGQAAVLCSLAVAYFIFYYFSGTLFFDIIHFLLHKCARSRIRLLRQISKVHSVHHWYFDRHLHYNEKYRILNALTNLPLELSCQLVGSWLSERALSWILQRDQREFATTILHLTLIIEFIRVVVVIYLGGRDTSHISFHSVPKDRDWILVGPEYHSLHHMYPDQFMSSLFRLFDWTLGTSSTLKNKRITMTGVNGAFGAALKKELKSDGVESIKALRYGVDFFDDDSVSAECIKTLRDTDILILAHGLRYGDVMKANYETSRRLVELFAQHRKPLESRRPQELPEVWYVGSEIEIHPSWGSKSLGAYSASKRRFLPFAKSLYDSDSVVYRHIVLAAFSSRMGPAIVSADWAARWTMWWIRRGLKYVPVTYTGFAYLNFFKFLFKIKAEVNGLRFSGDGMKVEGSKDV